MSTLRGRPRGSAAAQCYVPDVGARSQLRVRSRSSGSSTPADIWQRRALVAGRIGSNLLLTNKLRRYYQEFRTCGLVQHRGFVLGGAVEVPNTHAANPTGATTTDGVSLDTHEPSSRCSSRWAAALVVRGRAVVHFRTWCSFGRGCSRVLVLHAHRSEPHEI